MVRIALFTPTFYPANSGYANACTELAMALDKIGEAELCVYVAIGSANAPEGVRFRVIEAFPFAVARLRGRLQWLYAHLMSGFYLRSLINDASIDLILVETFELSPALYVASVLQSWCNLRRLTVRIHAATETELFAFGRHPVFRILDWFARRAAFRLPNISSTSEYYLGFIKRRWFKDNCLATFKNFLVLPNTLNRQPFLERTFHRGPIRLLALGRMSSFGYNQKNFELIAEAAHILSRTNPCVFAKLQITVIGDGEMHEPFRRMLASLRVDAAFTLIPKAQKAEVRKLQQSCTAALLISRYEGVSMFALECLAEGAPLIVSADTALDDLVEDGVNGFRVSSSDASELADAISKLTQADLRAFSANARVRFDSRFGPDVVTSKLLTFAEFARSSAKPRGL